MKILTEEAAKLIIERFAKKQRNGYFACPRCGRMSMDSDSVTRNALSRRVAVYVCDTCGTEEAFEDIGALSKLPLTKWTIVKSPAELARTSEIV